MMGTSLERCGPMYLGEDSVRWRVWAPRAERVDLLILPESPAAGRHPMQAAPDGLFSITLPGIRPGTRYLFSLNGGEGRQDPCSLWQPDGTAKPSAVVRTGDFDWSDAVWKGIPRKDLVFYELHVGTFTDAGTFEAVIPRLAALRELGITAIELMPVGQFPGARNWGYDGVLPYAAQNTYGGPHGLQKLVDAAHREGLAVFLDVVYNHFGPEHNYLDEFGPYFTDAYKTPWGRAINYDGRDSDPVRAYVLNNVRMWLDEFHLDGLRLDAVHAIYDLGATHILKEIEEVAQEVALRANRAIHIVAESDLNDPRIVRRPEQGGYGIDAQWSDDFHHVMHAYLTEERRGYYADYGDRAQVAHVLEHPFVYAGQHSAHRGRRHGAPATGIPGDRFVVCLQNHDQVGNRAVGERLTELVGSPAQLRLAASLLLFSAHLPLLFMGEEYGELRRFPFFCSFCGPELVEAVREGRKREFADFVTDPAAIPDPHAESTFASAKLTWAWPEGTVHAGLRRLYKDLLAARRKWAPLQDVDHRTARLLPGQHSSLLELTRGPAQELTVLFNLADVEMAIPSSPEGRTVLSSEEERYAGKRHGEFSHAHNLLAFECVAWLRDG